MTDRLFDVEPVVPRTTSDALLDDLLGAVGEWLAATGASRRAARERADVRKRGQTAAARQGATSARAALVATYERVVDEIARLEGRA